MIKYLQKLKAKKGFTLVELIVVIAIIGVLAAILIPTMLGYVTSSRVQSANSTATELKNTINNWITDMDTKGYAISKNAGAATFSQDVWDVTVNPSGNAVVSASIAIGTIWSSAAASLTNASSHGTSVNVYGYLEEIIDSDYTLGVGASFRAFINEGKCVGVIYYADGAVTSLPATDVPTFNQMINGVAGFLWSSTDGVSSANGAILGTSPQMTTALS